VKAASDLGPFLCGFPRLFPIADRPCWVGSIDVRLEFVARGPTLLGRENIVFRLACGPHYSATRSSTQALRASLSTWCLSRFLQRLCSLETCSNCLSQVRHDEGFLNYFGPPRLGNIFVFSPTFLKGRLIGSVSARHAPASSHTSTFGPSHFRSRLATREDESPGPKCPCPPTCTHWTSTAA